jgi:hypothetical protein
MKPEDLDKEILEMIAATFLAPEAQFSVQDIKDRITKKFSQVSVNDVEDSLRRLIGGGKLEYGEVRGKTILVLSET